MNANRPTSRRKVTLARKRLSPRRARISRSNRPEPSLSGSTAEEPSPQRKFVPPRFAFSYAPLFPAKKGGIEMDVGWGHRGGVESTRPSPTPPPVGVNTNVNIHSSVPWARFRNDMDGNPMDGRCHVLLLVMPSDWSRRRWRGDGEKSRRRGGMPVRRIHDHLPGGSWGRGCFPTWRKRRCTLANLRLAWEGCSRGQG
eukprot:scaffold868_cov351-Pavlova_lutheri.AAC.6